MPPTFQEAPLSRIPGLRVRPQLGDNFCAISNARKQAEPPVTRLKSETNPRSGIRPGSHIVQIRAFKIRPMCEVILNRPATPLHDAHQGGCFVYSRHQEGGHR
jgi:hypothetical protein